MPPTEYIGYLAGIITTFSLFPQTIKILASRHTRDISLVWAAAMNIGLVLWLAYGIILGNLPMIAANSISLLLLFTILVCKILWK